MIIAVSGLSGCGKNTIGQKAAEKLGLRLVSMSFKDEAKKRGISLMELQELAGEDPKLDKELDDAIAEKASAGNCVVTTWLGPWMVKNADLRVWLNASPEERAKRVSGRDKMAAEEALEHVNKRDEDNRARYKKYYGIDIDDHSRFDLEINTERFAPEESAELIASAAVTLGLVKYETQG